MERFIVRAAAALLFAVCPSVFAQVASTQCGEREVVLDGRTSVAKLDGCGGGYEDDLLWHLDRIDQIGGALDGTFDRRNGGAGSVIYVMDTGVRADHVEFAGARTSRVVAGFDVAGSVPVGESNCTSNNKALAPCYGNDEELAAAAHGTSVASIAAGHNIGVAPEASVVSIRVMNERGLATTRTYLDGLDAIVQHAWSAGAPPFRTAIVNISGWVLERLSGTSDATPSVPYSSVAQKMRDMVSGVDAQGRPDPNGRRFFFVVAANNVDGGCGPSGMIDRFPAILGQDVAGIITVGGMTRLNTAWMGSCRGGVEVLAPAQSIFSATVTARDEYRGKRPNLRSGTSFAAPIIAGIAARLLSDRPELTPSQLEAWITATPSRVENPDALLADGKVAYVRSIAPGVTMAQRGGAAGY
ncbi:MAG TPA: S8 family serine peptidase [Thermoanaerobaculia bacterium]|nr:S8 family serine peptidase [Thermoanaerobaculia bacterium]